MFEIRQYRESDKEAVWNLHSLALRPMGVHVTHGPWDDDLNDVQNHYLKDGGEFLVGLLDHRLICMGAFRRKSDTLAEIKRMRVHPDYQRKGFGQTILSMLEAEAGQMGYREICLDTTTKQFPAQKLYEKNGYQEIRRGVYGELEIIFYLKKLNII
jgi:ribosomal protein S18 acetylase RimI-like enzyme